MYVDEWKRVSYGIVSTMDCPKTVWSLCVDECKGACF